MAFLVKIRKAFNEVSSPVIAFRRVARLAQDPLLAAEASHLYEEVRALEAHLAEFEGHMNSKTKEDNGH